MNVVDRGILSVSDHWVALLPCIGPRCPSVYNVSWLQYSATKVIMSSHKGSKEREASKQDNNFESWCLRGITSPSPGFLLRELQQYLFVFLYYSFTLQWYLQCQLGFQTDKKTQNQQLNLRLLSGIKSLNFKNDHCDVRSYVFNITICNSKNCYNNEGNNCCKCSWIIMASEI